MTTPMRDAYGDALLHYGGANPDVVVLDADVSTSTRSCLFAQAHPDRFFNVGIAESNMTGMAAGLAAVGKIAVANTFAIFFSTLGLCAARGLISYSNLNVKLMATSGGMSDSFNGPSHHANEDLAIMRTLPNFTVLCASDTTQLRWMVKTALEQTGPYYVRMTRGAVPDLYAAGTDFRLGRAMVLREGDDAAIIATGVMVGEAVKAAEMLAEKNLRVRVIDMFTLKPLDARVIVDAAATGAVVTAEEHSVIGGLGSAVAEVLTRNRCNPAMEYVGVQDRYTETGPYDALLHRYGLDAHGIAAAVERAIAKKRGSGE